jgi:transcriptional regulator with XRE-family HTH domain
MNPPRTRPGAGERLKTLRVERRLTTREVEQLSLQISESKGNSEYYISHAWLTDIENGEFTPSIYKLYSLSTIYRSRFTDILEYFGLNLSDISRDQMAVRIPRTQIISGQLSGPAQDFSVPAELAGESNLDKTRMLARLAWQKLPLSVLQLLNPKDRLFAYVGLQDFTLYPLIRPGSFLEVDSRQTKVRPTSWSNEHDRPIYFIDLRDSYVCSWCQLDDNQLSIVPHPNSRQQIRRFKYPVDAEIVGRVTAVAMRIVDLENDRSQ